MAHLKALMSAVSSLGSMINFPVRTCFQEVGQKRALPGTLVWLHDSTPVMLSEQAGTWLCRLDRLEVILAYDRFGNDVFGTRISLI
jgi:hypothetical protein